MDQIGKDGKEQATTSTGRATESSGKSSNVRKSSRSRKRSKKVLDGADTDLPELAASPVKKKAKKKIPTKKNRKDFLDNGRPFVCSLCNSKCINPSRVKNKDGPVYKERDGQMLQLCIDCGIAVSHTESKGPSQEQKHEFEEEGRQFAQHLAKYLGDNEAIRLYCSFYAIYKCGCIQNFISGSGQTKRKKYSCSDPGIPSLLPGESFDPPDEKADKAQKARYLLQLLKESKKRKNLLRSKRSRTSSNQSVSSVRSLDSQSGGDTDTGSNSGAAAGQAGEQDQRAVHQKGLESFILVHRTKLKKIGICERGCQRVLCYSNNFLHKKSVFGKEARLQRTKGKAALGQLDAVEDLPNFFCCDKACVKFAELKPGKVAYWRSQARQSQRESWKVISEILTSTQITGKRSSPFMLQIYHPGDWLLPGHSEEGLCGDSPVQRPGGGKGAWPEVPLETTETRREVLVSLLILYLSLSESSSGQPESVEQAKPQPSSLKFEGAQQTATTSSSAVSGPSFVHVKETASENSTQQSLSTGLKNAAQSSASLSASDTVCLNLLQSPTTYTLSDTGGDRLKQQPALTGQILDSSALESVFPGQNVQVLPVQTLTDPSQAVAVTVGASLPSRFLPSVGDSQQQSQPRAPLPPSHSQGPLTLLAPGLTNITSLILGTASGSLTNPRQAADVQQQFLHATEKLAGQSAVAISHPHLTPPNTSSTDSTNVCIARVHILPPASTPQQSILTPSFAPKDCGTLPVDPAGNAKRMFKEPPMALPNSQTAGVPKQNPVSTVQICAKDALLMPTYPQTLQVSNTQVSPVESQTSHVSNSATNPASSRLMSQLLFSDNQSLTVSGGTFSLSSQANQESPSQTLLPSCSNSMFSKDVTPLVATENSSLSNLTKADIREQDSGREANMTKFHNSFSKNNQEVEPSTQQIHSQQNVQDQGKRQSQTNKSSAQLAPQYSQHVTPSNEEQIQTHNVQQKPENSSQQEEPRILGQQDFTLITVLENGVPKLYVVPKNPGPPSTSALSSTLPVSTFHTLPPMAIPLGGSLVPQVHQTSPSLPMEVLPGLSQLLSQSQAVSSQSEVVFSRPQVVSSQPHVLPSYSKVLSSQPKVLLNQGIAVQALGRSPNTSLSDVAHPQTSEPVVVVSSLQDTRLTSDSQTALGSLPHLTVPIAANLPASFASNNPAETSLCLSTGGSDQFGSSKPRVSSVIQASPLSSCSKSLAQCHNQERMSSTPLQSSDVLTSALHAGNNTNWEVDKLTTDKEGNPGHKHLTQLTSEPVEVLPQHGTSVHQSNRAKGGLTPQVQPQIIGSEIAINRTHDLQDSVVSDSVSLNKDTSLSIPHGQPISKKPETGDSNSGSPVFVSRADNLTQTLSIDGASLSSDLVFQPVTCSPSSCVFDALSDSPMTHQFVSSFFNDLIQGSGRRLSFSGHSMSGPHTQTTLTSPIQPELFSKLLASNRSGSSSSSRQSPVFCVSSSSQLSSSYNLPALNIYPFLQLSDDNLQKLGTTTSPVCGTKVTYTAPSTLATQLTPSVAATSHQPPTTTTNSNPSSAPQSLGTLLEAHKSKPLPAQTGSNFHALSDLPDDGTCNVIKLSDSQCAGTNSQAYGAHNLSSLAAGDSQPLFVRNTEAVSSSPRPSQVVHSDLPTQSSSAGPTELRGGLLLEKLLSSDSIITAHTPPKGYLPVRSAAGTETALSSSTSNLPKATKITQSASDVPTCGQLGVNIRYPDQTQATNREISLAQHVQVEHGQVGTENNQAFGSDKTNADDAHNATVCQQSGQSLRNEQQTSGTIIQSAGKSLHQRPSNPNVLHSSDSSSSVKSPSQHIVQNILMTNKSQSLSAINDQHNLQSAQLSQQQVLTSLLLQQTNIHPNGSPEITEVTAGGTQVPASNQQSSSGDTLPQERPPVESLPNTINENTPLQNRGIGQQLSTVSKPLENQTSSAHLGNGKDVFPQAFQIVSMGEHKQQFVLLPQQLVQGKQEQLNQLPQQLLQHMSQQSPQSVSEEPQPLLQQIKPDSQKPQQFFQQTQSQQVLQQSQQVLQQPQSEQPQKMQTLSQQVLQLPQQKQALPQQPQPNQLSQLQPFFQQPQQKQQQQPSEQMLQSRQDPQKFPQQLSLQILPSGSQSPQCVLQLQNLSTPQEQSNSEVWLPQVSAGSKIQTDYPRVSSAALLSNSNKTEAASGVQSLAQPPTPDSNKWMTVPISVSTSVAPKPAKQRRLMPKLAPIPQQVKAKPKSSFILVPDKPGYPSLPLSSMDPKGLSWLTPGQTVQIRTIASQAEANKGLSGQPIILNPSGQQLLVQPVPGQLANLAQVINTPVQPGIKLLNVAQSQQNVVQHQSTPVCSQVTTTASSSLQQNALTPQPGGALASPVVASAEHKGVLIKQLPQVHVHEHQGLASLVLLPNDAMPSLAAGNSVVPSSNSAQVVSAEASRHAPSEHHEMQGKAGIHCGSTAETDLNTPHTHINLNQAGLNQAADKQQDSRQTDPGIRSLTPGQRDPGQSSVLQQQQQQQQRQAQDAAKQAVTTTTAQGVGVAQEQEPSQLSLLLQQLGCAPGQKLILNSDGTITANLGSSSLIFPSSHQEQPLPSAPVLITSGGQPNSSVPNGSSLSVENTSLLASGYEPSTLNTFVSSIDTYRSAVVDHANQILAKENKKFTLSAAGNSSSAANQNPEGKQTDPNSLPLGVNQMASNGVTTGNSTNREDQLQHQGLQISERNLGLGTSSHEVIDLTDESTASPSPSVTRLVNSSHPAIERQRPHSYLLEELSKNVVAAASQKQINTASGASAEDGQDYHGGNHLDSSQKLESDDLRFVSYKNLQNPPQRIQHQTADASLRSTTSTSSGNRLLLPSSQLSSASNAGMTTSASVFVEPSQSSKQLSQTSLAAGDMILLVSKDFQNPQTSEKTGGPGDSWADQSIKLNSHNVQILPVSSSMPQVCLSHCTPPQAIPISSCGLLPVAKSSVALPTPVKSPSVETPHKFTSSRGLTGAPKVSIPLQNLPENQQLSINALQGIQRPPSSVAPPSHEKPGSAPLPLVNPNSPKLLSKPQGTPTLASASQQFSQASTSSSIQRPNSIPIISGAIPRHAAVSASQALAFRRISNTPTDAVGPPNITIVSPSGSSPAQLLKFSAVCSSTLTPPLSVEQPVRYSQEVFIANQVQVSSNNSTIKDAVSVAHVPNLETGRPKQGHSKSKQNVLPSTVGKADNNGRQTAKSGQGSDSLKSSKETDAGSALSIPAHTGSSASAYREQLLQHHLNPGLKKPSKPRKRSSTINDILKMKNLQKQAEASKALPVQVGTSQATICEIIEMQGAGIDGLAGINVTVKSSNSHQYDKTKDKTDKQQLPESDMTRDNPHYLPGKTKAEYVNRSETYIPHRDLKLDAYTSSRGSSREPWSANKVIGAYVQDGFQTFANQSFRATNSLDQVQAVWSAKENSQNVLGHSETILSAGYTSRAPPAYEEATRGNKNLMGGIQAVASSQVDSAPYVLDHRASVMVGTKEAVVPSHSHDRITKVIDDLYMPDDHKSSSSYAEREKTVSTASSRCQSMNVPLFSSSGEVIPQITKEQRKDVTTRKVSPREVDQNTHGWKVPGVQRKLPTKGKGSAHLKRVQFSEDVSMQQTCSRPEEDNSSAELKAQLSSSIDPNSKGHLGVASDYHPLSEHVVLKHHLAKQGKRTEQQHSTNLAPDFADYRWHLSQDTLKPTPTTKPLSVVRYNQALSARRKTPSMENKGRSEEVKEKHQYKLHHENVNMDLGDQTLSKDTVLHEDSQTHIIGSKFTLAGTQDDVSWREPQDTASNAPASLVSGSINSDSRPSSFQIICAQGYSRLNRQRLLSTTSSESSCSPQVESRPFPHLPQKTAQQSQSASEHITGRAPEHYAMSASLSKNTSRYSGEDRSYIDDGGEGKGGNDRFAREFHKILQNVSTERQLSQSPAIRHDVIQEDYELSQQMMQQNFRAPMSGKSSFSSYKSSQSPPEQLLTPVHDEFNSSLIPGRSDEKETIHIYSPSRFGPRAPPEEEMLSLRVYARSPSNSSVNSLNSDVSANIISATSFSTVDGTLERVCDLMEGNSKLSNLNEMLRRKVTKAEQQAERFQQQRHHHSHSLSPAPTPGAASVDSEESGVLVEGEGRSSPLHSFSSQMDVSHLAGVIPMESSSNAGRRSRGKHPLTSGILLEGPSIDQETGRLLEDRFVQGSSSGIRRRHLSSGLRVSSDYFERVAVPHASPLSFTASKIGSPSSEMVLNECLRAGDPLVSSSTLRPPSQLDNEISTYSHGFLFSDSGQYRQRYPSSVDLKPMPHAQVFDPDSSLDGSRLRNIPSSLNFRIDPPDLLLSTTFFDSLQRQRNPSSSSMKDGSVTGNGNGNRSRNPSSSSLRQFFIGDFPQPLNVIRSRNPSGSSNRRSRPGSSSSDREFSSVNLAEDFISIADLFHTRSRNSSGDSNLEATVTTHMPLDIMQIYHA
ncbi:hypothetical protein ElyMa_001589900 [Elysia marginata]|uniref:Uncharacterized protein n=1 Tax=Elysia marginata TaxID=1093978 RepID=A0AAV4JFW2_9GAST|nr:hypothetical protein ElyMa_001589900 [Elysia marginata]